jgi:DNA-binding transcriptional LysR family regulator
VYRDVVATLGPYCVARINPISSVAAMVSLVRSGYGLATLPIAAIQPSLESGELRVLAGVPDLAPLPVVASRRTQAESPVVTAVEKLALNAPRTYSQACFAGSVVPAESSRLEP